MRAINPCSKTIARYHELVFGDCPGFIALRSFSESSAKVKQPSYVEWIVNDANAVKRMVAFAEKANAAGMACYCIPGTVRGHGQAKSDSLLTMQTLLMDIDTGETLEKLYDVCKQFRDPDLIVHSGGITEVGHPKLHLYWQMPKPATGEDIKKLVETRYDLAWFFGGDESFKSACQPIRIAGSIYHKTQPAKLVTVRRPI